MKSFKANYDRQRYDKMNAETKAARAKYEYERRSNMTYREKALAAKKKAEKRESLSKDKLLNDPTYEVLAKSPHSINFDSDHLNFLIDIELLKLSVDILKKGVKIFFN